MKFKILIVAFFSCLMATNYCYADSAKEEIIIIKDKEQPADPKSKPRAPAKRNVEAWLDGTVMTIVFTTSEGDATLSLETSDGFISEEMVYSTEAPIVIDLAPYGEVTSFTVETEAGHTYVGYLQ